LRARRCPYNPPAKCPVRAGHMDGPEPADRDPRASDRRDPETVADSGVCGRMDPALLALPVRKVVYDHVGSGAVSPGSHTMHIAWR
jgi:hypothetical protein